MNNRRETVWDTATGYSQARPTDSITITNGGVPVHNDDRQMFEYLTLECLQCGLSWGLMMKKRNIFRRCFENFEYDKIAAYDEDDVQRILNTDGMLKSERKVRAVINNARCCQKIREEFGSFCDYLWAYTDGKTVLYDGHADGALPVSNGLSDRDSKDMKKRGFKFIGSITIYSHLQACGIINDHAGDCPCYQRINKTYPTIKMKPDREIGQTGGKVRISRNEKTLLSEVPIFQGKTPIFQGVARYGGHTKSYKILWFLKPMA